MRQESSAGRPAITAAVNVDGRADLIEQVNLLTPQGWIVGGGVRLANGCIEQIHGRPDLLAQPDPALPSLLPGIIDAHGDAFEREITPRSGAEFPLDLALATNDHALIGAGITTFYFSITDGFEPGLRSRQTVRQLLQLLEQQREALKCDTRIHIRHEQVNTDDHAELMQWLASGRIDLLSLNDHLPHPEDATRVERFKISIGRRLKFADGELDRFIAQLQERRPAGLAQVQELAALARERAIPLASHDDRCTEDVTRARALGVSIAEFPLTLEVAQQMRALGIAVLVGAPNLVRGGSHLGALGAAEAIAAESANLLCSDYHYASLFRAPFVAAEQGLCSLAQAWRLVSSEPAKAVGIAGRTGSIEEGKQADLLLLQHLDGSPLSLRRVWSRGRLALCNG